MFRNFLLACFIFCLVISGFGQNGWEYKINSPDKVSFLPDFLREVSGITVIDSLTMACIQDENAIIYLLDRKTFKIKSQFPFGMDGDYEGIACVKNTMYILRSDGVLFEVNNYNKKPEVVTYNTNIPANNNEGLCYDELNNRLLIGCKSKPGKGPAYKDYREVYAFDLLKKQLNKIPVFKFNVEDIKGIAIDKGIELPTKEKKKGSETVLRFTTSAIAIHPITQKIYLISSADKLLFVFTREGRLEDIMSLNPSIHPKPEGIIFFKDGTLIITNEGLDKKPSLLVFSGGPR